ncbi:MAG: aminobenzoyl-glutamate transporter [Halobacteriovoraceae bacterium]|nr:aminobenzoyl-glutamate transporter [Halobacteriovoraceae bacterium]|tara:strand:- start:7262 stop:8827 length:1566 start_codon:yes stop_codon:yes gene_type:complete
MQTKKTTFQRFLTTVERLGNVLPHPVTLFAILCLVVLGVSQIADWIDLQVLDPRPEGSKNRAENGLITAIGLISPEGIRLIFKNLVTNYTSFAPLGTVLVTMLAVGVAEYSGMLTAFIRGLVLKAPDRLITFAVVFAGILSNTASELGYVVLIPLGGYVFISKGRHPLAGMAAAFAGVSGGYSANLFIGTIDPLLSGITQEAARLIAPDYTTHAAINWYFMMISTVLISTIGTFVTEKIVEPNLGEYDPKYSQNIDTDNAMAPLTSSEKRGLMYAGLTVILLAIIAAITILPSWGILRDPVTGDALKSPFMKGIVTWIFIFFFFPAVVYGKVVGSIKSDKDVIEGMTKAMSRMGLYMVLVFFAAQFIAFFKWSNLGTILAVSGANLMQSMEITGPGIFVPFILMCCFVNLMLGSASAQWAVTAPIFVPMLMLIGYAPEVIQAAYRIGDSTTNIITPMMSYFGLILAFAEEFDKRMRIGTIISTMLPYSMLFIVFWTILFYLWVFVLGMPVGPDAPTYFQMQ